MGNGPLPPCETRAKRHQASQGVQQSMQQTPRIRAVNGNSKSSAAGATLELSDTVDVNIVFNAYDVDKDNSLSFLETVMLAHHLPKRQIEAYPFPFQHRVMESMLMVDLDHDKKVALRRHEFTA